jgi:hypothetical protein
LEGVTITIRMKRFQPRRLLSDCVACVDHDLRITI